MKEQSHKNEMRAALRGDFERLQARRQETVEASVAVEPEPVPAAAQGVDEPEPSRSSWLDRLRDRR